MKKKPLRYFILRPTPMPSTDLPFGARSVGYYHALPGFRDKVKVKHFVQVFWGIRGTGALVINGAERKLKPRQIAVYFPGMRHEVYALNDEWEYCFWTMDGPMAAGITAAFGLSADIFDAGEAPLPLFRKLEKMIRGQSPAAEREASALAYRLLTLAASGRRQKADDQLSNKAVKIIHDEWNRPQLSVKELAERLHLHRSSFSRRFEAALGIAPITYLTRLRVQNALSLLGQTEKPVAEIARLCGYNDPNYFSRLIHHYTGLSPHGFRGEKLLKSRVKLPADGSK
jgi:AraC-like DNA-binding protein